MIYNLLTKLSEQGIKLKVEKDDLHVDAPKGALTETVVAEIRKFKPEIITYLKEKRDKPAVAFKKAEKKEYYRLSAAQRRMFLIHQLDQTNLSYNMVTSMDVGKDFDPVELERILNTAIERHEGLRTSFHLVNNEPVQIINASARLSIQKVSKENASVHEISTSLIKPFDLSKAPLIRAFLVEGNTENHLLIDIHHIVTDGVSQDLLTKEITLLHGGTKLKELNYQYKDYSEHQYSIGYRQLQKSMGQFWLNNLAAPLPQLSLPADFKRPVIKQYQGNSVRFYVAPEETKHLRKIAEKADATMFMAMLAVFNVYLEKLSGQNDIIVGIPFSGRYPYEVNTVIGMFINTLPFRSEINHESTFNEFLQTTRKNCLLVFENQEFQFDNLVADLKVERDQSRNPIFDVLFEFFDKRESKVKAPLTHDFSYLEYNRGNGQFDLSMNVTDCGEFLCVDFDYSTSLYKPETIDRFIGYFKHLMKEVICHPEEKIYNQTLLSDENEKVLLKKFNNTQAEYPSTETIVSLFEKQVKLTPTNVATKFGARSFTYEHVQTYAHKLANYLHRIAEVKSGDLVGVLLEREEYLIVSIFGILKAACAYVPIDPNYPEDRIRSIIEDSGLKTIITRSRFETKIPRGNIYKIDLDVDLETIGQTQVNSIPLVTSRQLAYVLYTSGSTGKPKGVMIEHHSVVNRILWMQKMYPIGENDVILQKTPIVFDVSVWELFWWSFTGASVVLLKPDEEKDPEAIIRTIQSEDISTMHFVPSMLSVFLSTVGSKEDFPVLKSLKYVFASGEALKADQVNQFGNLVHTSCDAKLINLYGPTEATVDVSYYECSFDKPLDGVPIGRPIDNIELYIVDKMSKLVPIGIAGELCIAGVGLARGYLGNKKLTEEKFVNNPFKPGERMYRTGDLARWMQDGNIDFLGRIDHQVKIRGFRIELGEIESQLAAYNGVQEAVVTAVEKNGDKYLVAYYVSELAVDDAMLRNFLATKLPEYMIPIRFIWMDKMPVTTNGKLDRKALPTIDFKKTEDFESPTSEVEKQLRDIWSEILTLDKDGISINHNFFELGGHSLKAMVLSNQLTHEFGVAVPLHVILTINTIKKLAAHIENERWILQGSGSSVMQGEEYILD